MSDMVEVVIDSVRVSLMSPQRVVVLRQTEMERYLATVSYTHLTLPTKRIV